GSSLPGFQTQVMPQIIKPGIGAVLFYHPAIGTGGNPQGNPVLDKSGFITFQAFFAPAFGRPPAGSKYDALYLMNDISTQMQRGIFLPKGSPPAAAAALRQAFATIVNDRDFIADYRQITGEDAELVSAEEVERIFERIRSVDPEVKRILKESVGSEG